MPPPRHAFGGIVGGESIDSHRKPRQRQRERIAQLFGWFILSSASLILISQFDQSKLLIKSNNNL